MFSVVYGQIGSDKYLLVNPLEYNSNITFCSFYVYNNIGQCSYYDNF